VLLTDTYTYCLY